MTDELGDANGPTAVAQRDPMRMAFTGPGARRTTYGDFETRTARLARALAGLGVVADGRVAIMMTNSVEFFEAWAAAGRVGASVVLVNWHLKRDELAYILSDSGASVLVAQEQFAPIAEEAAGPSCRVVVAPAEYEALIAGAPELGAVDDCVALAAPVFYTSGTTGRPKGVIHGSYDRAVAATAQQGQVALWGWTADDVYILS